MRRISISLVTVALAYIGMAGNARAANDRFYIAGMRPTATTPLTTTNFQLNVTNDLKNGPTHPIRQIIITVPTGFTLVPLPGGAPAVTAPPNWIVYSIVGQKITVTTTGAYELTAGKSVAILINAISPGAAANCSTNS